MTVMRHLLRRVGRLVTSALPFFELSPIRRVIVTVCVLAGGARPGERLGCERIDVGCDNMLPAHLTENRELVPAVERRLPAALAESTLEVDRMALVGPHLRYLCSGHDCT